MYDILDLHTHTTASGHAYNSLCEMVRAAAEAGLTLFGCSDHTPAMPGSCELFHFINFKVIPRELYGVKVLMGAELNIMDFEGTVDLPTEYLERMDYCIASLHPPCIKSGAREENTAALLHALENPHIHIIGHPDDDRYPLDYEALVSTAKRCHKLLEMNNSSLTPRGFRPGAADNYRTMLELCRRYQQPVIIDSDAHFCADVGNHRYAHELLEELDFPEELIVNTSLEKLAPYIPRLARLMAEGWEQ